MPKIIRVTLHHDGRRTIRRNSNGHPIKWLADYIRWFNAPATAFITRHFNQTQNHPCNPCNPWFPNSYENRTHIHR